MVFLQILGGLCVVFGLFCTVAIVQTLLGPSTSNGTSGGFFGILFLGTPAAACAFMVGFPLLYPPILTTTTLGMLLIVGGFLGFLISLITFFYIHQGLVSMIAVGTTAILTLLGFLVNAAVLLNGFFV